MVNMNRLLQRAAMLFFRPYISWELPGWGRVYSLFDGGYRADQEWAWLGTRWVRGKLHGYDMFVDLGQWSNRQTFFLRRLYDLPTQLVLQRYLRAGDTFIDIGANEGAISLLASRLVGSQGRVLSFEPNPRPRAIFQATIDRNKISNITVIPFGLGDRDDTLQMTAPKINSGEGSFGKSNYSPEDTEYMTGHGYQPFKIGSRRQLLKHGLTLTKTTINNDVDGDILWLPGQRFGCQIASGNLPVCSPMEA
jgi:FkbM family methyltransferase